MPRHHTCAARPGPLPGGGRITRVRVLTDGGSVVGDFPDDADSLGDEQVLHRQMVLDLRSDEGLSARVAGNPIKFDGEEAQPHHYPPALAQHSRQVLQQVLGLGDDEYEDCLKKGIVREAGSRKDRN